MSWSPKHPAAKEIFGWDFAPQLAEGVTLQSFVGVTLDEAGDSQLLVTEGKLNGETQVSAWIEGGTNGISYLVRAEAIDSNGERLEVSNWLPVSIRRGALAARS